MAYQVHSGCEVELTLKPNSHSRSDLFEPSLRSEHGPHILSHDYSNGPGSALLHAYLLQLLHSVSFLRGIFVTSEHYLTCCSVSREPSGERETSYVLTGLRSSFHPLEQVF